MDKPKRKSPIWDSRLFPSLRICVMRTGISITVSASDRRRLEAIVVSDRNAAQKHVWRALIVLLTADDLGTYHHGHHRQLEDNRLALAGTVCRGGYRGPAARQDRPPGNSPITAGKTAEVVRLT